MHNWNHFYLVILGKESALLIVLSQEKYDIGQDDNKNFYLKE